MNPNKENNAIAGALLIIGIVVAWALIYYIKFGPYVG